jgi:hypothetical protein
VFWFRRATIKHGQRDAMNENDAGYNSRKSQVDNSSNHPFSHFSKQTAFVFAKEVWLHKHQLNPVGSQLPKYTSSTLRTS